jgi:hypothetical protein
LLPRAHAADARTRLLAAWQSADAHHIGLIGVNAAAWRTDTSMPVPTRAHGLWAEAGGTVLAVARRPGDWLLRWRPGSTTAQWHWIGDDRRFNGHVITSADSQRLWTTETDLDSAQGLLGVRDARSLEKTAEWPSQGMDPHQLLALPQAVGRFPAGTLIVANGGIPTLPETGRLKTGLGRMDASLVALHPGSGELLGQWRLADPRLSIRHLAWDPVSARIGIALQAEHTDPALKAAAPVLALWDGRTLRAAEDQPPLAGYGGDICAWPGGGFAVSCPRVHQLALFDALGRWRGGLPQAEACALASAAGQWWLGGRGGVLQGRREGEPVWNRATRPAEAGLQIDNHWVALPA